MKGDQEMDRKKNGGETRASGGIGGLDTQNFISRHASLFGPFPKNLLLQQEDEQLSSLGAPRPVQS